MKSSKLPQAQPPFSHQQLATTLLLLLLSKLVLKGRQGPRRLLLLLQLLHLHPRKVRLSAYACLRILLG
jgi:hypothetical protein